MRQHPVQNLAGYYIDPVPGYRLSQGIHDNNAVDLAIAKGTPIHAAAFGRVIFARYGYNGGFGNVVIIDHANGTQTLYAHQSKLATKAGDEVYQGQVIGYVGSTGHSTGPHLHFEVHGAQNPGAMILGRTTKLILGASLTKSEKFKRMLFNVFKFFRFSENLSDDFFHFFIFQNFQFCCSLCILNDDGVRY